MPSFGDWLKGSWDDYRRRWAVMLAVAGVGAGATLAGVFAPFMVAALASVLGLGPAWAVWGAASALSLLAALWLSTWAQAAATRAAVFDEPAASSLKTGWAQTSEFAWVLTLVLLAAAGGFYLLVVPGLLLAALLFAAPFCQIRGEADGVRALALSWARVRPHFGAVCWRLIATAILSAAPGWIPYVGWLLTLFWAPFGLLALARLDRDLREAVPAPEAPAWMGAAVAGLSVVFVVAGTLSMIMAVRTVAELVRSFNEPGGLASRVRPETLQALLDSYTSGSDDEQKRRLMGELLKEAMNSGRNNQP